MASDSNFGDPRFQPAAFTRKQIMAAFAALAARHPFFNVGEAGWLVPIIQRCDVQNVPHDKIVRIVRDSDPAAVDRLLNREPAEEEIEIDVTSELTAFADRTGLIDAAKASYMVSILTDGLATYTYREKLASQIKTAPPLLDAPAKRAAGINARLKLGAPFVDSLTGRGREDPAMAAQALANDFLDLIAPVPVDGPSDKELLGAIILAPFHERSRRRRLQRARDEGGMVQFWAMGGQQVCEGAKTARDTIYELVDAPELPLAQCDKLECSCMLMNLSRDYAERKFGYITPLTAIDVSPYDTDATRDRRSEARDGLMLFTAFMARQQNCRPNEIRVVEGDPMEAVELLWFWMKPMQDLRRDPKVAAFLDTLGYDPTGAGEFDAMLERIARDGPGNYKTEQNATVTVWTERTKQAIMMMQINARQGLPTILPPPDMSLALRQAAVGLLWLYRMELPFPPGKSGFVMPASHVTASIESEAAPQRGMEMFVIVLAGLAILAILLLLGSRE